MSPVACGMLVIHSYMWRHYAGSILLCQFTYIVNVETYFLCSYIIHLDT